MTENRNKNKDWRQAYVPYGSGMTVQRVNDATVSTSKLAVSAESVSFSAGAAGTTGVVGLDKAPIYNATGTELGHYRSVSDNDTSFAWVTGTVLTTPVMWRTDLTDAEQLVALTNGQYSINYDTGKIRYKKATTGTSDTCNYTTRHDGTGKVQLWDGTDTATVRDCTATKPLDVILNDETGAALTSLGGGSGAGGGNNTYSTEQGDFTAEVTDATNSIVLSVDSIGGVAITAANFANGLLKVYDASTEEMETVTLSDFTWTSATKTLNTANCKGAFTFNTGDVVSLTLIGPDKLRDSTTDAQRTSPIRDTSDQHVSETLVDTTNVSAATTYYPSSSGVSMDGYSHLSIQGMTSGGVTTTLEVTLDDASSPDWIDITSQAYDWVSGAYASSYVDVNMLFFLENLNAKALRIKSVTSDATNAVQYNIRRLF